jgi:O-antigen ligase
MAEAFPEASMKPNRDHLLELGGFLVALFLPLYFNPFANQPFEAVKVALFQAISISMMAVACLSALHHYHRQHGLPAKEARFRPTLSALRRHNPLFLPAILYTIVYLLATAASINPQISFGGVRTGHGTATILCQVLFFLLLTTALQSRVQVERMITALLLGSVPVALYGWVQYLGLDALKWSTSSISPVLSTLGRSLFLGSYLAMVIPFTLSRIVAGQRKGGPYPLSYSLILILQITCLLFTMARGAWLGFLGASLLFLGLLAYRNRSRKLLLIAITVLITGSCLFMALNRSKIFLPPGHAKELSDTQVVQGRLSSNNFRLTGWRYTLALVPERYLLGYGPETFTTAFAAYYPQASYPQLSRLHSWDPHNVILSHLTETGVLGLLTFSWLLVRFYKTTFAAFRRAREWPLEVTAAAILSSVTAFIIQAQFNPNVIVLTALFWLLLALGVAVYEIDPAGHPESNAPAIDWPILIRSPLETHSVKHVTRSNSRALQTRGR